MAKLYWTGDVGYYNSETGEGITTQRVLDDLKELSGAKLEVELTTFGGDYFMAAPIMNALRAYAGEKVVYLNGIVAFGTPKSRKRIHGSAITRMYAMPGMELQT